MVISEGSDHLPYPSNALILLRPLKPGMMPGRFPARKPPQRTLQKQNKHREVLVL